MERPASAPPNRRGEADALFPLPLTPFERFLLVSDGPEYPMTCWVVADFQGEFEPSRLEGALEEALERHPMLRTRMADHRRWAPPDPVEEALSVTWEPWTHEAPPLSPEPLDVGGGEGLRFRVQQGQGRSRWVVEFHHALVDGMGFTHFLRDVAALYERSGDGGAAPTLAPLNPHLLRRRGTPGPSGSGDPPETSGTLLTGGGRNVARFLLRRPHLLRREIGGEGGETAPDFEGHTLDPEESARLRSTADRLQVSLNDLLLCALFRSLARWNAPTDPFRSSRWIRVLVPVNLRTRKDLRMPAANRVGLAFVDRRHRECANPTALVQGIAQEMREVRRRNLGWLFTQAVALVDRVPGLLRLLSQASTGRVTAVFSNGGELLRGRHVSHMRSGEGIATPWLQRVCASPPLRRGTRVGFMVNRCREELTITLYPDRRHLGEEASQLLLAIFVQSLEEVAALAPEREIAAS